MKTRLFSDGFLNIPVFRWPILPKKFGTQVMEIQIEFHAQEDRDAVAIFYIFRANIYIKTIKI